MSHNNKRLAERWAELEKKEKALEEEKRIVQKRTEQLEKEKQEVRRERRESPERDRGQIRKDAREIIDFRKRRRAAEAEQRVEAAAPSLGRSNTRKARDEKYKWSNRRSYTGPPSPVNKKSDERGEDRGRGNGGGGGQCGGGGQKYCIHFH